jgi:ActD protein
MFLTAEFGDAQSVRRAIEALKTRGLEAGEIDLFSAEPVELPEGLLERPSRMSLAAVAGAAAMCLLATLFVRYTQYDYRVVTGGMPLFSWWATGVVFYEFTMFGAIVTTFVMFLAESGLIKRGRSLAVPRPAEGSIHLRVRCVAERAAAIADCLYQTGAASVTNVEDA